MRLNYKNIALTLIALLGIAIIYILVITFKSDRRNWKKIEENTKIIEENLIREKQLDSLIFEFKKSNEKNQRYLKELERKITKDERNYQELSKQLDNVSLDTTMSIDALLKSMSGTVRQGKRKLDSESGSALD